jgi:hypothetical protein
MGSTISINKSDLSNDKVREIKSTPTFIEPELCQEVPMLQDYCGNETMSNKFHCEKLKKILFLAINSQHKGDTIFDTITEDIGDEWDRTYHIKSLMEYKAPTSTIYNTINAFNKKCAELEVKYNTPNDAVNTVSPKETKLETKYQDEVQEFKNTPTFIEPDLCQEVPILHSYCGENSILNTHDCQNLQRSLFRAANSQYEGDTIFDTLTGYTRDEQWDRAYHIKSLMEYAPPATIYNTIKIFNEKCDELKDKSKTPNGSVDTVFHLENETTH